MLFVHFNYFILKLRLTRLVNGDDVTVGGRIQIYKPYGMTTGGSTYNSKYGWGTVCEEYFDNIDAKVTCRGINAITTDAYPTKKYGYVNSGYAWMKHMGCTGSEAQLNDCKRYNNQYSSSYYGWYGYSCAHYQDIGVICPHGCLPNYEWDLSRGRCERIPDIISPAVEIFCENKCPSGK